MKGFIRDIWDIGKLLEIWRRFFEKLEQGNQFFLALVWAIYKVRQYEKFKKYPGVWIHWLR